MRKGQTAFEYMSTIGIALFILIGLVAFAYSWTTSSKESMALSIAENSISSIVESANLVYAQGYPARTTIVVQIPNNVEYANIEGNEISMRLRVGGGGHTDVSATAKPSLVGTLPTTPGYYRVAVVALTNYVNVSVVS